MVHIQHNFVVNAPLSKVYEAISSVEGLCNWWTTDTTGNAEKDGVLRFGFGGEAFNKMKVTASKKNSHLAWLCTEGPVDWIGTDLSFTLREDNFKNTSPSALYDIYMNAKKHSIATDAPAKISNKAGSKFSAHNGYINGENIQLVKNKLIVQTWRAEGWDKKNPDSIFVIHLEAKGKDTVLYAIHAGLPDKHFESINKGCHNHYWGPWKKWLSGKPIVKSPEM